MELKKVIVLGCIAFAVLFFGKILFRKKQPDKQQNKQQINDNTKSNPQNNKPQPQPQLKQQPQKQQEQQPPQKSITILAKNPDGTAQIAEKKLGEAEFKKLSDNSVTLQINNSAVTIPVWNDAAGELQKTLETEYSEFYSTFKNKLKFPNKNQIKTKAENSDNIYGIF